MCCCEQSTHLPSDPELYTDDTQGESEVAAYEFIRKENYLCIGNKNACTKLPDDLAMQAVATNNIGTVIIQTITVT